MPRDQGLVLLGRCAMDLPHAPSRPLSRYARNASHVRQRSDDHLQVTFVPYWDPAQCLWNDWCTKRVQPPLFVDLMVVPLRTA